MLRGCSNGSKEKDGVAALWMADQAPSARGTLRRDLFLREGKPEFAESTQ
jgi:hypothetical protein